MLYADVIKVKIVSQRSPYTWYKVGEEYWVKNGASGFAPHYSLSAEYEGKFIFIEDYIII